MLKLVTNQKGTKHTKAPKKSDESVTLVRPESLTTRVVQILRREISTGRWRDTLPGERKLCEQIGVSRETLRHALAELKRDNVIKISVGRPTRINRSKSQTQRTKNSRHIVGLVTKAPIIELSMMAQYFIGEIRQELYRAGFSLNIYTGRQGKRTSADFLHSLESEEHVCGSWILFTASHEIQSWFDKRRHKAIILGTRFPKIELPSIDYDYSAIVRHAVGMLRRRGHKRIALLRPDEQIAGVIAGEEGFRLSVAEIGRTSVEGVVAELPTNRLGAAQYVDKLMQINKRPTGFIVWTSVHAIEMAASLIHRGIRIPQDASIICLCDDPHLAAFTPQISRYRRDSMRFSRKLRRMVLELARKDYLPQHRHLITPELIEGKSINKISFNHLAR